jgi:translation elongation factor Ts
VVDDLGDSAREGSHHRHIGRHGLKGRKANEKDVSVAVIAGGLPKGSRDLAGAHAQVEDGLAAMLEHARKVGVRIGLEPLHPMYAADRACVNTLRHANDLCDRLGEGIGVLVDVTGGDAELGKDLAMHIAASKPKALDASGVPAESIETERRVAAEKAAEDAAKSGKSIPPEILAKRVEGTVQKFLKEVTLLGQPFVKDDKLSIEQLLKSKGAKVEQFVLYVVGEGIEKKQSDFAAEVAAAAATRG